MDDPAALRAAFHGAHGVYSVQNGLKSGFDREVTQRRNVADAADAMRFGPDGRVVEWIGRVGEHAGGGKAVPRRVR